ncbi:MAG: hypothetical protein MZW92_16915 [Comamonadaceae bacterium]|nr:hypothetical protein [Comamonadaceae bacterium]
MNNSNVMLHIDGKEIEVRRRDHHPGRGQAAGHPDPDPLLPPEPESHGLLRRVRRWRSRASRRCKRACCTPGREGHEGDDQLAASCAQLRKSLVELILSNHAVECPTCASTTSASCRTWPTTWASTSTASPRWSTKRRRRPVERTRSGASP